jgi:Fic family protein
VQVQPPSTQLGVVHHEILLLHPFTGGSGRVARFWQHVTLLEAGPLRSELGQV